MTTLIEVLPYVCAVLTIGMVLSGQLGLAGLGRKVQSEARGFAEAHGLELTSGRRLEGTIEGVRLHIEPAWLSVKKSNRTLRRASTRVVVDCDPSEQWLTLDRSTRFAAPPAPCELEARTDDEGFDQRFAVSVGADRSIEFLHALGLRRSLVVLKLNWAKASGGKLEIYFGSDRITANQLASTPYLERVLHTALALADPVFARRFKEELEAPKPPEPPRPVALVGFFAGALGAFALVASDWIWPERWQRLVVGFVALGLPALGVTALLRSIRKRREEAANASPTEGRGPYRGSPR